MPMTSKWEVPRLGQVALVERTTVKPENIISGTTYIGMEHIDNNGEFKETPSVEPGELASNKFSFDERHVLYGKLRPYLKKIARPNFHGICSTDILPILPKHSLDKDYLYYFLRQPHMIEFAVSRCSGANLPRLSPKELAEFPIPLPPLEEQKRIAAILDKSDAIRKKGKQAIELTEQFLRSAFLDIFGDPITNPKSLPMLEVKSVCKIVRGSSPRPKGDPRYYGGSVPRLMVGDVTRDGWFVTPKIDSLTEEGAKKSRPVVAGTVVMAVSGNVGVMAQLQVDACVHDGFVAFTELNEDVVLPEYLMICLDFLRQTHEKRKAGAIFQNLTTNDIKTLKLPVPPLPLQERIISLLKQQLKTKQGLNELDEGSDALFSSIIQRAFRGEL